MLTEKYKSFLHLVVYQVYPRSFCDSNGDGIGDLRGVISKLDYLKELGINAIWLSPCFKSPNDDNGYDVSDYRDIMDEFGTLDDAKALISEMHKRNMLLFLDLVPNHTSTSHKWFIESRKSKDNPYSDYYYWADEPLTDWNASFGGKAWEYDETRKQYYLHSYAVSQADLNWDNPAVVKEMQSVVDYWVDLGVDGFRIDVIDQISKDIKNNKNCFGPHLHEYINALFGREKTKHIFTVGECWASNIDEVKKHCAAEREELSTLFQFDHIECGRSDKYTYKKESLAAYRDILVKWQNLTIENDLIYTLFTDNHDQSRFISRMGNDKELRYESATCIAAMTYLLRGVPFIFEGQEFGSAASYFDDINDFRDIETLNAYKEFSEALNKDEVMEKVNFGSRDNPRRPMAWTDGKNGGFSECDPWMPSPSRYKEINLKSDILSKKSVFAFYKNLLKLRKSSEAFTLGSLKVLSKPEDKFFVFEREYEKEKFLVVCNFEEESVIENMEGKYKPVLANCGRKKPSGKYSPYECAVYRAI